MADTILADLDWLRSLAIEARAPELVSALDGLKRKYETPAATPAPTSLLLLETVHGALRMLRRPQDDVEQPANRERKEGYLAALMDLEDVLKERGFYNDPEGEVSIPPRTIPRPLADELATLLKIMRLAHSKGGARPMSVWDVDVDTLQRTVSLLSAMPADEVQALRNWLREPDWAEEFSLDKLTDWINRRPVALVERIATARGS